MIPVIIDPHYDYPHPSDSRQLSRSIETLAARRWPMKIYMYSISMCITLLYLLCHATMHVVGCVMYTCMLYEI